ncbi:MAG: SGNH/GDSL hydrolase family protein [Chloroflexota bacterium]
MRHRAFWRAALSLTAGVAALLLSAPATASVAPAELPYLALGDSVASGAELGDSASYPRKLGVRMANETGRPVRYWNRARQGEQSAGVLAAQLDGVEGFRPTVVTLTVGANDFLVPALECIAARLDNDPASACQMPDPRTTIPEVERNIRAIVGKILRDTEATVAVTTYYNPFPRTSRCAPALVDLSMRYLNASIGRATTSLSDEFPNRVIVVDLMETFKGHEGHEPTGWFLRNPVRLGCTDIHPNGAGHTAIAETIWAALAGRGVQ